MTLFLDRDEVEALTGYKLPRYQVERLRELGLVQGVRADFVVSRDGYPRVYRHAIGRPQPEAEERQTTPDYSALDELG